jgi:hypothetical protein
MLISHYASDFEAEIRSLCDVAKPDLGLRQYALLAAKLRHIDWVREQKETWNSHGPWDRRAIIAAAHILPSDERRHWLRMVAETEDILDVAIAKSSLGRG